MPKPFQYATYERNFQIKILKNYFQSIFSQLNKLTNFVKYIESRF
jgi:hypothetical protein